MVELLSGVLSGAAVGTEVGSMDKQMDRPQNVGHFFSVLNIEAFMDLATFKARIDKTIDRVKALPRRPGVDEILPPGERGDRWSIYSQANGIVMDAQTIAELKSLCHELDVEFMLA